MSDYAESKVCCPFYKKRGGQMIRCEGLVDGGSITLGFPAKRAAGTQWRTFCCGRYERCEIYRAVCAAKYEE